MKSILFQLLFVCYSCSILAQFRPGMGSNQGHTQVSPVGTVVVSSEEEPISVSVMY